jgi:hypothetical protein
VIRANFPADAEWTHASFPATRNPVSSKCARRPRPGQILPAAGAPARLVNDNLIRRAAELQGDARLPLRPTRLTAALPAQRLGRRPGRAVLRRRLRRITGILPQPRAQVRDLRGQRRQLRPQQIQLRLMRHPQRRDLGVSFASTTCRSRALAACSAATSSGTGGTSGTTRNAHSRHTVVNSTRMDGTQ